MRLTATYFLWLRTDIVVQRIGTYLWCRCGRWGGSINWCECGKVWRIKLLITIRCAVTDDTSLATATTSSSSRWAGAYFFPFARGNENVIQSISIIRLIRADRIESDMVIKMSYPNWFVTIVLDSHCRRPMWMCLLQCHVSISTKWPIRRRHYLEYFHIVVHWSPHHCLFALWLRILSQISMQREQIASMWWRAWRRKNQIILIGRVKSINSCVSLFIRFVCEIENMRGHMKIHENIRGKVLLINEMCHCQTRTLGLPFIQAIGFNFCFISTVNCMIRACTSPKADWIVYQKAKDDS